MIENSEDLLYELENKQVKGAKLRGNIRWELEGKKWLKTFFKVSAFYTDENKSKYSSNPKDIFKFSKEIYEKPYNKETTSKAPILNFLEKFLTERKYLINNLIFVRRKYL